MIVHIATIKQERGILRCRNEGIPFVGFVCAISSDVEHLFRQLQEFVVFVDILILVEEF